MTARELALRALQQAQDAKTFVQDELHALLAAHKLSVADKALATEIALGTMRQRRTLDLFLQKLLKKPIRDLHPVARLILQTAAYQMVFLERIPDYAVVDEAVNLMRSRGDAHLTGLTNAVLRKLPTLIDRETKPETIDNPRRLIPLPRGGQLVLRRPLLPPEPVSRLATAYSFQEAMVQRWLRRWGEKRLAGVLGAMNRPPHVFARINTQRITPGSVLSRLPAELRPMVATGRANLLDLTEAPHEILLALLGEGLITIEDPTALLAVEALEVQRGMSVLDLCAAPGGKTSYLAEMLKGQGTIYALDQGAERLELLRQTVVRLGLTNVRIQPNEPAAWQNSLPKEFDRVLVDVPCSNSGVLNRRVDARWRFSIATLRSLAETQRPLLEQGARATRIDGLCVYSTCSLEPEENSGVVRRFAADNPWMVLQVERETLPSDAGDGGYYARFVRKGPAAS